MNTLISYRYRDASNNHVDINVVVAGTLPKQQITDIAKCLHDGDYFIPGQVGLPETRFDNYNEQDDHIWFEIYPFNTFKEVPSEPTETITIHQVYANFMAAKDHWNEEAAMARLTGEVPISKPEFQPSSNKLATAIEYMDFIKNLHGVTTVTLAAASGLDFQTLYDIENRKRPPTYEQLKAISNALNLSKEETARMFDIFGQTWNQFGIPLDIVHYIKTEPDALSNIRAMFKPEIHLSPNIIALIDTPLDSLQYDDRLFARARNAICFFTRLKTLGQVAYARHVNYAAFSAIRNMGTKSRERLEEILASTGILDVDTEELKLYLESTNQLTTWFSKHSLNTKL